MRDLNKSSRLVQEIIAELGEDVTSPNLIKTPERVVRSWDEIYAGYSIDPRKYIVTFPDVHDEMIVVANIEMYSMCAHHMLPFFGRAHVGYIAGNGLLGVSKLARIVDCYSKRLQLQETICNQIVDFLIKEVKVQGAGCLIEAEHLCMRMRGVSKQNSIVITSALGGCFKNQTTKEEFLSLINLSKR